MLRIGDVAKMYSISNRTLRYWEGEGILESFRTENGYRYYDDFNTARIKQIVLLRKLEMPISSIERLFTSNCDATAIEILNSHLKNLRSKAARHHALASLTEQLILHFQSQQTLDSLFECLEEFVNDTFYEQDTALQILRPERNSDMSANGLDHVRIVKLPAMTVASYRAESASPEDDCSIVFNRFVLDNQLHKRDGYRQFGFNNPSPSESSPIYGYEMWVTVPDNFDVPLPLEKKVFSGGLYASISTNMNEIGERWQRLHNWCKNNERYDVDVSSQWLEECSMGFEAFISKTVSNGEKQLDLLEPVKEK